MKMGKLLESTRYDQMRHDVSFGTCSHLIPQSSPSPPNSLFTRTTIGYRKNNIAQFFRCTFQCNFFQERLLTDFAVMSSRQQQSFDIVVTKNGRNPQASSGDNQWAAVFGHNKKFLHGIESHSTNGTSLLNPCPISKFGHPLYPTNKWNT